jgi:hypothetical protein
MKTGRTEDPDINKCSYNQLISNQVTQQSIEEERTSSTNDAGKSRYAHMEH